MEQASKIKYDEATENRPTIVDPREQIIDSDQNQRPPSTSDVTMHQSKQPIRQFKIDHKGQMIEVTPKNVEMLPKSTACAATDVQRRRGILTEPQQLEGAEETSLSKNDSSPKTLKEKKERYLKNANEMKTFSSRPYIKKEFENKSIAELASHVQTKVNTSNQNESNQMTGETTKITDASNQDDSSVTSSTSETEKSSKSSNVIPEASKDLVDLDSMKEKDLAPIIETHFAPDQTKIGNGPSENPFNEIKNYGFVTIDPESSEESLFEHICISDGKNSNMDGGLKETLDGMKLQVNSGESVSNVLSESKIDVDDNLHSSSALPPINYSYMKQKSGVVNSKENEDEETQKVSLEESNNPANENAKENFQSILSHIQEKCYMERKSPDSSSGIDTDNSEREDTAKIELSLMNKVTKSGKDLEQNSGSDFIANDCNLKSGTSKVGACGRMKTGVENPNDDENSSMERSDSSMLSISELQTKELVNLMNDVNMYSRASLDVLKAENISVIPNIKFNVPHPLPFEPELPESIRENYEILGVRKPTLPIQRADTSSTSSTTIQNAYSPFTADIESYEEVPSTSAADQASDDYTTTSRIVKELYGNRASQESALVESMKESDDSLFQTMLNRNPVNIDILKKDQEKSVEIWERKDAPLNFCENYFNNPQYNEVLPDDPGSEKVPDLTDEPKGLEVLPLKRRPIPYLIPSPQNPDPVPVPEEEPTPEQNQEPAPEGESPSDPEPTPQPSPEPQEETVQEEHSTSEPTTKSEEPSGRNEEEETTTPSVQSEEDEMDIEEDTSRFGQDILKTEDISKHVRQSQTEEPIEVVSECIIPSPNDQKHDNNPDLNVINPNLSTEKPDPVTPSSDQKNELLNASSENQNISVSLAQTTSNQGNTIDNTPLVITQDEHKPEVPMPSISPTNKNENRITPADVEIDTCPVPDLPNISDEEPESLNPPSTPYDRQNGPTPTLQGIRSVLSQNPDTNSENTTILHEENDHTKKSREVVNKPKENLIVQTSVDQRDEMDIQLPFESNSDEGAMTTVNIPEPVQPPPEIIIETLPSTSQSEGEITEGTNQNMSEQPEKKEDSNSKHAPGHQNIPGLISCTQPSGPEDTTRRDSSDSNQQDATESAGTSRKNSKTETTSNTAASTGSAVDSRNLGGSGSDEDEDEKKPRKSGTNPKKSPTSYPKSRKNEEKEDDEQKKQNEVDLKQSELEPRILIRSQSDEAASKKEETKILGARTLSKSNEGPISCTTEDQISITSSGSSGAESLPPIQNSHEVKSSESDESIITIPYEESEEDKYSANASQPAYSCTKRKEAPTPDDSEVGPNKHLAREDGESEEPEVAQAGVPRPARITHRRQPVPSESEISDLDRAESGISEVDCSSDRDASVGEVSESAEEYKTQRRLTRHQASKIEAYQQQQKRSRINMISSEYDKDNSPSPEPVPRSQAIMNEIPIYDSSDSGSTLVPKDSVSSDKCSEPSLSSNSNEQAAKSAAVPRQPPRLEDLNLPQDAQYDIETHYYRRRPTSDESLEFFEIVSPPHSEKRKRSSPTDQAETKKVKTEEGEDQQGASAEVDRDGDVNMKVEEPVSDADREVAAIMSAEIQKEAESEKRIAINQTRNLMIFMPQDNKDRTRVVLFPPKAWESSFVPYKSLKKLQEAASKNESCETSKKEATEEENINLPKEESTAPPKEESTESFKGEIKEIIESPKQEPNEEKNAADNRRESFGTRRSLRNRDSLEPPKKNPANPKESAASSFRKDVQSRENVKADQKGAETKTAAKAKPWKSGKTTQVSTANQNKSAGGSCKEPTNKKSQQDDKDDPDTSSQRRSSGRRQTKSPVKKPNFRR